MFTLKDVTYRDIVDIPHLDIPSGKVTCIVGRSGSGKTTTLRMLNRMISPDTGTILYKGTPISEIDPVRLRRQVVMLPQTPVMFDGTIRDNLLIGLQFSEREPVPDDALRRVMEIMDLRKKLDDDAATLSGGEKQRVALGRILVMRPDAALLDEPSSALDEGTERAVIGRLADAARERGVTVVMVTHSRPLAEAVADHLVEIEAGRVVTTNGVERA
ncbi:MAG TPA: ATP-binding cassette domain-containing protein [Thermomicrobiales bacterium]|jgi:putative ABC transport system ATP-binding protein|nr:ATP-binding cassette domain-containing protein [Thermomicrobiales bacterium]